MCCSDMNEGGTQNVIAKDGGADPIRRQRSGRPPGNGDRLQLQGLPGV